MIKIEKKECNIYKKRTGSYVIIEHDEDDQVAIASDNEGVYFFLGGGAEKNESSEETLKRELTEETGYSLKNIKYFDRISSYCYSDKYGYIDVDATIFVAQFDKKIAEPIEKDHKVIWVSPLEYKDKLYHKYQKFILNKYILNKDTKHER